MVSGDRNYKHKSVIETAIKRFDKSKVTIIHGGCRGADSLAEQVCKQNSFVSKIFYPDYDKYGSPRCFHIRNDEMLKIANILLVFHTDLQNSKGTKSVFNKAMKIKLPIEVYPNDKEIAILYNNE